MLPSALEFSPVPENLDGKVAVEHYLGRSLAEAEQQIVEHPLYYIGDFMWMGPIAFRYYLPAVHAYFVGEQSNGDANSVDSIIGIVEHRLAFEAEFVLQAYPVVVPLLDTLLSRYQAFEISEEILGDLRSKVLLLRRSFD